MNINALNIRPTEDLSRFIGTDASLSLEPPARMRAFTIDSHGARMNAVLYQAPGIGPHPTVVLLHGFPGNEPNLDLAHSIRRSGWNVLIFHYRGSWGSEGEFTFRNTLEDTAIALEYLRKNANAESFGVDEDRIVLVGHSMGGFLAARVGADDPKIIGIAMLTAANMGPQMGDLLKSDALQADLDEFDEALPPLRTQGARALMLEADQHRQEWDIRTLALELKDRPVLILTVDDGLAPANRILAQRLAAVNGTVEIAHLDTDHQYSDKRIELQTRVLSWLTTHFQARTSSESGVS